MLVCTCGDEVKHVSEVWNIFLPLTRFLRVSLNEKLLLLNFPLHFFHLVPCIWEFWVLKVNNTFHAGKKRTVLDLLINCLQHKWAVYNGALGMNKYSVNESYHLFFRFSCKFYQNYSLQYQGDESAREKKLNSKLTIASKLQWPCHVRYESTCVYLTRNNALVTNLSLGLKFLMLLHF